MNLGDTRLDRYYVSAQAMRDIETEVAKYPYLRAVSRQCINERARTYAGVHILDMRTGVTHLEANVEGVRDLAEDLDA